MAGVRKALIVATDEYGDPKLARLDAPATDARALAEVLQDPDVGAFEVDQLLNRTCHEVEVALMRFLAAGRRGDTLLLHFSGHGVKDLGGELYFATTDTDLSVLKVTGVASSMVKEAIEESRASLILCLVDCCYSGAFTKSTKAAATLDLTERLGGQGRAVITASTSLQLALDGKEEPSLFTKVVVEGLRSGDADRDLDGLISLDELYSFVHERVTAANPDQTPVKSFDVRGEVYVARRGNPVSTPAPLPQNLLDTLATGEVWERRGAVTRLSDLLVAGHPGRALAAKLLLERVRDGDETHERDDSSRVRQDADAALLAAGAEVETAPPIPIYAEFVDEAPPPDPEPAGASSAEAGTKAVDTAPYPGPAGTADEEEHESGSGGRRRRVRWALGLAAMGGVLLVVYLAVVPGDEDGIGGGSDSVTLPESEMLVPVDVDGDRQIVAVDVDTGKQRVVISDDDAFLPTLTHDRRGIVYLRDWSPEKPGVPYLARIDGSGSEPLLDPGLRERCPHSDRPSESLDGGDFALVCLDDSKNPIGLFRTDTKSELSRLYADRPVRGATTWTGHDEIVFAQPELDGDKPKTLWRMPADGSARKPTRVPTAEDAWASNPDWSDAGLLYVLSGDDGGVGDAHLLRSGRDTTLTDSGKVIAATWSPDAKRFAFVTREAPHDTSLWVQDAEPGAEPDEIEVSGEPGVPAWGAR